MSIVWRLFFAHIHTFFAYSVNVLPVKASGRYTNQTERGKRCRKCLFGTLNDMQDYLLLLGSVTEAMKAKRALASQGIKANISKRSDVHDGGCRYGLLVSEGDLLRVTLVLREENIPYRMGI